MTWDEGFASRYEEWSAKRPAAVAFYIELARKADGPLVEVAIGNGRVAIPVAQATGQRVIGIDSSPAMLEQARGLEVEGLYAGFAYERFTDDSREYAFVARRRRSSDAL